jgi:hypothetical protein
VSIWARHWKLHNWKRCQFLLDIAPLNVMKLFNFCINVFAGPSLWNWPFCSDSCSWSSSFYNRFATCRTTLVLEIKAFLDFAQSWLNNIYRRFRSNTVTRTARNCNYLPFYTAQHLTNLESSALPCGTQVQLHCSLCNSRQSVANIVSSMRPTQYFLFKKLYNIILLPPIT